MSIWFFILFIIMAMIPTLLEYLIPFIQKKIILYKYRSKLNFENINHAISLLEDRHYKTLNDIKSTPIFDIRDLDTREVLERLDLVYYIKRNSLNRCILSPLGNIVLANYKDKKYVYLNIDRTKEILNVKN